MPSPLLEFVTFNYANFLARQGVYSLIDRPPCERAYEVIQQILPEPQASLLSGILLGVDAGLPVVVHEDFRSTGATHIIAISG